ncbi:MAG: methyltransferase [Myxococcota bacterium]
MTEVEAERIRRWTEVVQPYLVPELKLHQITADSPLWRAGQPDLDAVGWPEPYWAFAWAGGQALARYILDHPESFRGQWWDVGAGSGLVGLAAARAGARVICTDIDPVAATAMRMNAALNDIEIQIHVEDWVGRRPSGVAGVLLGDMTYDQAMTERVSAWLRRAHPWPGAFWVSDPDRGFFLPDPSEWQEMGSYDAPSDVDADGTRLVRTRIHRSRSRGEPRRFALDRT